jgi:hypothetical protein
MDACPPQYSAVVKISPLSLLPDRGERKKADQTEEPEDGGT